jgi:RNA polymerase-binding protein DksA
LRAFAHQITIRITAYTVRIGIDTHCAWHLTVAQFPLSAEVNLMNVGQVPYFERKLRARLAELRGRIHDALLQRDADHYSQLAGEVHDAEDEALADVLVDVNLAAITREVQEIRDIDAARRRILLGQYGLCVHCGEPIDPRRLEAYPTAKRCLECQRTYDRSRALQPPPSI